jgi:hypothetical protein
MKNNSKLLYLKKRVNSKDVRLNSKKLVPVSPNRKRKRKKELRDRKEWTDPETPEEESHSQANSQRDTDKSTEKALITLSS